VPQADNGVQGQSDYVSIVVDFVLTLSSILAKPKSARDNGAGPLRQGQGTTLQLFQGPLLSSILTNSTIIILEAEWIAHYHSILY